MRGSEDREKILLSRREKLMREARRKYLEKQATSKLETRDHTPTPSHKDTTQIKVKLDAGDSFKLEVSDTQATPGAASSSQDHLPY